MKKAITKFLKIGIPLGLGLFLIWYSYSRFTQEQLDEIFFYFTQAKYSVILAAVGLSFLSHVIRAYRWKFLLEPLGYSPKLLNSFMAISIAYFMNLFIPKSGEISRGVIIDKYEKIPFNKAFGTIISERVVDLILLFIFTGIAFALQFSNLYSFTLQFFDLQKIVFLAGGGLLALVFAFIILKYFNFSFKNKIISFLTGIKTGILSIFKMKQKFAFLGHSILIWCLYLLSFYVALFALEETSTISLSTVIITFVVGSFSFAFTNSGFGSYPFFVASILALFAIPETVGTAFGWIVWTSNILSILFFGGLSFAFLPLYNKDK